MSQTGILSTVIAAAALVIGAAGGAAAKEPLAKNLFGSKRLPAAVEAKSYGFYSKGCFSGGIAIARDGPRWQAMRISRNRRWGHPDLIRLLERLSRDAVKDGWNGLLVGDISQPRGGPMLSGHASHQIGLDADIWFTPMPEKRYSVSQRERLAQKSVLKRNSLYVDERRWTSAYTGVLRRAASYRNVERILVHPGIKKKLCDSVKGDRSWLRKIRPFWGHDAHFHIRIGCPPGSTGCKRQASTPKGTGCDKSLAWWFTEEPWRPAKGPKKPKRRDIMTMASLPPACRVVLDAPSPPSEAAVTLNGSGSDNADLPAAAKAFVSVPEKEIPIPVPRPGR
ncbi:MAG: penicillin-insensitive murein endopeptidase [Rhizobiaceae bacterium]